MTRIFKTAWFQKFARKNELDNAVLVEAIDRADRGLVDADLGGGVIKQRIARPGGGKSGGYRTLILFRGGDRAMFAFGFPKSAQDNIRPADLKALRKAAGEFLGLNEDQMRQYIASEEIMEIDRGEED